MKQRGLGFVSLEASLSMDQSRVIMSITEEEDEIDDLWQYN